MLVLSLNSGEEVILFDREHNRELGKVKFFKSRYPDFNKIPLGFDFPDSILILRNELIVNGNRKESRNGNRREQ